MIVPLNGHKLGRGLPHDNTYHIVDTTQSITLHPPNWTPLAQLGPYTPSGGHLAAVAPLR